jgi:major membrane immunogen (membrane-anchored lipoprotein)
MFKKGRILNVFLCIGLLLGLSPIYHGTQIFAEDTVPVITTESLPNGSVDVAYSATLEATGGNIKWSGTLPAGLTLDEATGVISGAPKYTDDKSSITIKAENDAGSVTKILQLTITVSQPSITTTALKDGTANELYGSFVVATGGDITWSLENSKLPDGLELNRFGSIYGTPTTGGTFTFTIKAANTAGSVTKELSITIHDRPSNITNSLPNGNYLIPYSQTLSADGDAPITWSLSSGTLPAGLTLNETTGEISGTPTKEGNAIFTVRATNGGGYRQQELRITITNPNKPTFVTDTLPAGTVGYTYSQTILVTTEAGNAEPITWSWTCDYRVENWLKFKDGTIDADSILVESRKNDYKFTVTAENKYGSVTKDFSIPVYDKPSVASYLPVDFSEFVGEQATYEAKATPAEQPYTYQWQFSNDDGGTWADIDGATSSSYTTETAISSDIGNHYQYRCHISNGAGWDDYSKSAKLFVYENRSLTIDKTDGYTYQHCALTITGSGNYTIGMAQGASVTRDRIVIASSNATVTLNGINIDTSGFGLSAMQIAANATNVTVLLADGSENILKSADYCNGLDTGTTGDAYNQKHGITIGVPENSAGTGKLTATGGIRGAGIDASGTTISGGTITAVGGDGKYLVRGGEGITGAGITISGGTITATGGNKTQEDIDSEGIEEYGGGAGIYAYFLTISGGTITATGGTDAAGIGGNGPLGGGNRGNNGANIYITGGNITATGNGGGAGIGGGYKGHGNFIQISGGTVKATGGIRTSTWGGTHYSGAAGIGGGLLGAGLGIYISGGTVTAIAPVMNVERFFGGAGIGSGSDCREEIITTKVTITGGDIKIVGDHDGYGTFGFSDSVDLSFGDSNSTWYQWRSSSTADIDSLVAADFNKNSLITPFELNEDFKAVEFKVSTTYGVVVNNPADSNITRKETSGAAAQAVDISNAISAIEYTAADGYSFPKGYGTNLSKNGISANVSANAKTLTITGVPTANTAISLTSLTLPKTDQTAPKVTAGDCLILGTTVKMEYTISKDDTSSYKDCTDSSTSVSCANRYYVRYKETDTENASDWTEIDITASITVNPGSHASVISNNAKQNGMSGAFKTITVKAADGYYYPENYSMNELNGTGITLKRISSSEITVDGSFKTQTVVILKDPTIKNAQNTPDPASVTGSKDKINGTADTMEYSLDKVNWITCANEFTSLMPGTYFVRYKATDTMSASGAIMIDVQDPAKETQNAPVSLTVKNGKVLNTTAAMEFSLDGIHWLTCTDGSTSLSKGTYYIRYKGTDTKNPSDAVIITIPDPDKGTQDAPALLTAANGRIVNTTAAMEYSLDGILWLPCTDDATVLKKGTYYIRYKETDTKNASEAVKLTVDEDTDTSSNDSYTAPGTAVKEKSPSSSACSWARKVMNKASFLLNHFLAGRTN